MADSASPLPQMSAAADDREIIFNGLVDALSPSALFGRDWTQSTGLLFYYLQGRWDSISIAAGFVTATNAATNYMVALRSTGAPSISTSITNWNDTATYARLWILTASGGAITAREDHRFALGGLGSVGSGGSGYTEEQIQDIVGLLFGGNVVYDDSGSPPSISPLKYVQLAASDETTALTTGSAKITFRMPHSMTVIGVRASLSTAQATGSIFTVDVNDSGTTILSTKITIDNTEKTSTTAAAPPVLSDTALADDAEITVDIDQVGDGTAKGLKVLLIGY